VLEASLCLTGKLEGVEKAFDAKTLEAAAKDFRGMGVQELLLTAAWSAGYTGRTFRQGDLRGILQAAFSSADISSILSNVANKFLLEGFFSVERTWRNICSVRNVSDFKTVTSYRLIGTDQYELVAPGGELVNGGVKPWRWAGENRGAHAYVYPGPPGASMFSSPSSPFAYASSVAGCPEVGSSRRWLPRCELGA